MRRWFIPIVLTILLPASGPATADDPPARKPNVIVILTDDQGYGDFSCHGNPVLKTPNMDRLHDEAVRLTDFHVAPMCTPTRGQLLTGLDALHNAASSVAAGRSMIRPGIPTMAELFAGAGYRTAMFGKWHLGDSAPNLPHKRGFEEAVYLLGWGITSMADLWCNDLFDGRFHHNGELKEYPGYCTDVWFEQGMRWVRERAEAEDPFFLYLPMNAPHTPHWVADKYEQPYLGKGIPSGFFGMLANIDENLGKLDAFLRETGLRDDTILILLNDNGGTAGVNLFNAGMRGRKTEYYEGGHRAACFIRWPVGRLRSPSDLGATTEVQDLLPTLVDLCGLPGGAAGRFDGVSLADYLRDRGGPPDDRMLVVQYGQVPAKWDSAVLWNKWRLVHGEELYDLETDPGQARDVASSHPDVVRAMRDHYEGWWAGVEPRLNDFVPIHIGLGSKETVTLSAADWGDTYCDNMKQLRDGMNRNGAWHLLTERGGRYRIELRRWPREADAAISAGVPAFEAVDGTLPPGKALPIAKVRARINGKDVTMDVGPDDKGVAFGVRLGAGERHTLQSWCDDAEGHELCGAYFAYVRLVED